MKIEKLRFKNLNSLVGEWEIDLTHPEYLANGIFAITGQTGAGKSTILDAICLALYGQTPRLKNISQSTNEIMSRQAGECFAEVTFSTAQGRYRCHWSQRRARNKPDGKLQGPKQELVNADTDKILTEKIKDVLAQVEEITSMDFDRFTRSILLAQGGFAAFLQANADGRAPLLEKITGTQIYSDISKRVHERNRAESEKLKLLQAETKGIELLDTDAEQELREQLNQLTPQQTLRQKDKDKTQTAIQWLTDIHVLKQEIKQLDTDGANHAEHVAAFEPQQQRLSSAHNALRLDGVFATLVEKRKQQTSDQKNLETKTAELPNIQTHVSNAETASQAASGALHIAKQALAGKAETIKQVRALDQTMLAQTQQINESKTQLTKAKADFAATQVELAKTEQQRTDATLSAEQAEAYLSDHQADEMLVSEFAGIRLQLKTLIDQEESLKQSATYLDQAKTDFASAQETHQSAIQTLETRTQAKANADNELTAANQILTDILAGRLPREYVTEQETLLKEKSYLATIASLESHRKQLEDGKECPLCGATEHPFAEGNTPTPNEIDEKIEQVTLKITQINDQNAIIQQFEKAVNDAISKVSAANAKVQLTKQALETAESGLTAAQAQFSNTQTSIKDIKTALSQQLEPLNITNQSELSAAETISTLQERLNDWLAAQAQQAETKDITAKIDSMLAGLRAKIEGQTNGLDAAQAALSSLQASHNTTSSERTNLFGDKNPDTEEAALNAAITNAEAQEKAATQQLTDQRRALDSIETNIRTLTNNITNRTAELTRLQAKFTEKLTQIGFADEDDFLNARIPEDERSLLETKAQQLKDFTTELKTRLEDRKSRLNTEQAKQLTDKPLDQLQELLAEQTKRYDETAKAIIELDHRLNENEKAKERIKNQQAEIEAQKQEANRWGELHDLIGSNDGKKYRNFAQGLTFELMVSHANQQLKKMTDRYLLRRDKSAPLDLNVIDNYQAGEERSTKNLSGGESFIVSLALALGLSKMVSHNVRVDSLFLDEGFGTLDEDALDTALETLSSLQHDGKLIGVISHIQALKDRITTQITVSPKSGGKSEVSGPGCQLNAA